MERRNLAVKCVMLVVMLIASSATVPIVENDSITTTESPESREVKMAQYRLPNNTIPLLYNIHIEPNMDTENFTWTGKSSIDIEVTNSTPLLILHAHENLLIDENFTKLLDSDGTILTPIKHYRDNVTDFLKLQFDREISVGNYSLSLMYEGTNSVVSYGFFRAPNEIGDIPPIAATHFEPTLARREFPCWDEPGLKARFRVLVKHSPNYTALSNMPEVEHVQTLDGKILTTFGTTPIMSTYLLTFVIADYQNVYNEHRNVSLHITKGALEGLEHLLDFSPKAVEVMEAYTGFPFGLPRIGSVILQSYGSNFDGTDHWGLVSYSEEAIRIYPNANSVEITSYADEIIAHEMAHSWFGNRVTPLWWNDIWLSEGFAAYFQYYIIDMVYDNRRAVEKFVVCNNQEGAFTIDDDTKNPVRWSPTTNEEINLIFNYLTYQKGPAIVHMFRNVLGDDVFRAGIQKFMFKHSFKAADTDDLIIAFQEVYDEGPNWGKSLNLKQTMTPWLEQKGYPIVNVTRNYTTGDTEVSQRSTLLGDSSDKWWIPLTYATKSSPNFTSTLPASWISDKEDRAKIDGIDKDDWIVLNIRASGYYRVNYDDENWNRLADYLNTDNYTNIHMLNRAQFINDAFYLAQREPDRYLRIFHKITKYLSREVEYLPWRSAYNAFRSIQGSLYRTEMYKKFKTYIVRLIDNFVEKVGFEERDTDDHFTKLSRANLISWACNKGHTGCLEYASAKFIKYMEDPMKNRLQDDSHPNLENSIVCVGLRGLNDTTTKKLINLYNQKKGRLFIDYVACTENHEFHRHILSTWFSNNFIEEVTAINTFESLLESTEENFNSLVNYFLQNHRSMNNSIITNGWPFTISDLVSVISSAVTTRARLEKFEEVLKLDAVLQDPEIDVTSMRDSAEKNFAQSNDASDVALQEIWNELLSADNSTIGSQMKAG